MTKQLRLILLTFTLGLVSFGWATSKEDLHPQHPENDRLQVHTLGTAPDTSISFWERYAPPKNISTDGAHFDALFAYISWGTFVFFVIMVVTVVLFIYWYREKPGARAFYTLGLKEKKFTIVLDITFFIVLDCVLIYYSVLDTKRFFMDVPTGPDVVKVQVMPQQWVWNFRYAGADGAFNTADDIVTVNELWVPKGKTVSLQIKSKDVIHGFMVPNTRRQIDAIPGSITRLWFDTHENGDYEIACMHLCGTSHYKMKGFMKVVDVETFEAWSSEMSEWAQAQFDPEDPRLLWGWEWGIL